MSKNTARAALRFVTAYTASTKSSAAMVSACVDMLADAKPNTIVALVRGAFESKGHSFDSDADRKRFEILVSQRSYAAQLVLTVGEDAATDPAAINAALSVASGQLPRKTATAVAESFAGTNDAPGFAKAIKDAKTAHKPAARTPGKSSTEKETPAETPRVTIRDIAPEDVAWKTALKAIDLALANETDAKAHAAMVKALKATLLRHSMTTGVKAPVKA